MIRRLAFLVALSGSVACASGNPPPPESVSRVYGADGGVEMYNAPSTVSRVIPTPLDSVWQTLPRVYEMLGISEAAADEESKAYGAMDFRPKRIENKRLSTYIDCGMEVTAVPKADSYEVTMSLVTQLTPADDGGTLIETTLDAHGKPRAVTGNPVYCQSNGVLEARVADLVLWALVSGR